MAKGNLFQGMARGKVGDVVFSRLNGQQISRVRNRNPRNPRTNAQLFQRAIMATVMQAYSAGKEIFDHSYQGKQVGEGCQRYFMSKNAKLLRSLIAEDIRSEVTGAGQNGRVVGPGTGYPTPFSGMLVSEGSLDHQNAITLGSKTWSFRLKPEYDDEEKTFDMTPLDWLNGSDLKANDVLTMVLFAVDKTQPIFMYDEEDPYTCQYVSSFHYLRLIVREGIDATTKWSQDSMDGVADVKTIFKMQLDGVDIDDNSIKGLLSFDGQRAYTAMFNRASYSMPGCVAVIKSKVNEDLRSTETLQFFSAQNETEELNEWGIISIAALAAWKKGTNQIGDSDLILEGGEE